MFATLPVILLLSFIPAAHSWAVLGADDFNVCVSILKVGEKQYVTTNDHVGLSSVLLYPTRRAFLTPPPPYIPPSILHILHGVHGVYLSFADNVATCHVPAPISCQVRNGLEKLKT